MRRANLTGQTTCPLDGLSVRALAAYGLRKQTHSYNGPCIRVRRSSDNVERDIYWQGDGIDVATLLCFVAGSSGHVVSRYDHIGSATLSAPTAFQPRIVNAGALETKNNRPLVRFLSGLGMVTGSAAITLGGTTATGCHVFSAGTTGTSARLIPSFISSGLTIDAGSTTSAVFGYQSAASTLTIYRNGGALVSQTFTNNVMTSGVVAFDGSVATSYINNVAGSPAASSSAFGSTGCITIFASSIPASSTDGPSADAYSGEIIFFNAALSESARAALFANQKLFYGI